MNRRVQLLIGGIALVVILASVAGLAWLRMRDAREFSRPSTVQTFAGTNYVVKLTETTVGRTDSGCVVIVYAQLRNPNPFDLALARNNFILVDGDLDYYLPSTSGTQNDTIKLPANGLVEREAFSFSVPLDSFAGTMGLQIGKNYWVLVKDAKPYEMKLRSGHFESFRRRDW